ncbi:hypothetical protein J6590_090420 [Homalodisca vitripennis]|nr:hypothetical protein J6590_090420 [Homalodisca vitripennis]
MLSKRVELITVRTEEHLDPLRLVLQLRKLFEYNKKLNRNYSLRVANSLGVGMLLFLQSISAYWQVYGLHYVVDCYEYHAPIATVFAQGFIWYELLSIACSATRLNSSGSYSMTGGMRVRSGGVERVGAQSKVGE